ncbi:MAG: response regulator [Gammaproteobacteria bacterium]|jgi:CheY-like chemotaxis protein|nr:response regulator [Gammaproteobacteria bacterium]MBT3488243.1 response regulator [Gammaproteobacteria bacterium]MBT3718990.1 response regulator [Gammaproteobacteria bacterium]MBT3843844.1 response regulator [Gammaproteobacteria bacterium]MBT3893496.1 response regulator [Gammaproteobacteria bacterium]
MTDREIDYESILHRIEPALSMLKVLLVDDAPEVVETYRAMLIDLGFDKRNIITASNGLSAFTKATKGQYDLILADWKMPVMDGFEFVKKVRNHDKLKNVLIFMITVKQDIDVELISPFVNGFLKKPTTNADFEHILLSIIAKKMLDHRHPLRRFL